MEKKSSTPGSLQADLDEIVRLDRLVESSIKNLKVISLPKFRQVREKRKATVARLQAKGYK